MFTKEQLTKRLAELEAYEDLYGQLTTGFVGREEISAMEALSEQFKIEFDDWFSDRVSVERELEKL